MQTSSATNRKNVIINELLCFISNKADTMTYEVVVKLCNDFFIEMKMSKQLKILYGMC